MDYNTETLYNIFSTFLLIKFRVKLNNLGYSLNNSLNAFFFKFIAAKMQKTRFQKIFVFAFLAYFKGSKLIRM